MTNAIHSPSGARHATGSQSDAAGAALRAGDASASGVRLGAWVFTPSSVRFAREAAATLRDNDRCIPLRYTSTLLEDFVVMMEDIEGAFVAQSSNTSSSSGRRGDRQTGQSLHA
ncbi:hypothetical protein [Streptomyces sp. NPDC054887]